MYVSMLSKVVEITSCFDFWVIGWLILLCENELLIHWLFLLLAKPFFTYAFSLEMLIYWTAKIGISIRDAEDLWSVDTNTNTWILTIHIFPPCPIPVCVPPVFPPFPLKSLVDLMGTHVVCPVCVLSCPRCVICCRVSNADTLTFGHVSAS